MTINGSRTGRVQGEQLVTAPLVQGHVRINLMENLREVEHTVSVARLVD